MSGMEGTTGCNARTKVFLLCDNRLLREALVRILGKRSNIKIVGASAYSHVVLTQVLVSKTDVLLLDSQTFLPSIRRELPSIRMLMVGMERKAESFFRAVLEGVAGYIVHDASAEEVLAGIQAVARGEAVCPRCFSAALFRCAAQQLTIQQNLQRRTRSELSRREQQLVELICWGLTNKEIASRLHLSEYTVKNHVHRILHKAGAEDRGALIERYHSQVEIDPTIGSSAGIAI